MCLGTSKLDQCGEVSRQGQVEDAVSDYKEVRRHYVLKGMSTTEDSGLSKIIACVSHTWVKYVHDLIFMDFLHDYY